MSGRFERFEDFLAWQKARAITALIYHTTNQEPFVRDFGLKDQLRRALSSVMANIAEGFERSSPSEFQRFLAIGKGSCAELRSHLYVALDAGYLEPASFDLLDAQAAELGRLVGGLRASIERRRAA